MKVLHAAETIKGGVETVIFHLTAPGSPSSSDHQYCYVFPRQQVTAGLHFSDSPYHFSRPRRGIYSCLTFAWNLIRAIWKERPDIVHLHSTFAGAIGRVVCLLMRPFRPSSVIYCPHAFAFLMEGNSRQKRAAVLVERTLARITDKIVCVSKFEYREAINAGIPSGRLEVVYNGTPIENDYIPRKREPHSAIRLLYVGRFDYQKGIDILCEAVSRLPSSRFHLTVIGGNVRDSAVVPEFPPNTSILGWVDRRQLCTYYADCDILIMPSRWEGFAMTPLEGMANGLPVVASDCTSLPELISHGYNGYIFPTGRSAELARILNTIDPAELPVLGERARQTVAERFSIHGMIENTNRVYRTAIQAQNS